jgi:AcrR family transcriptional regulator
MEHAPGSAPSTSDPRRQRIVEAAQALLLSVGYDDATTNAIAQATHLSKATIYSWWASKEALFTELLGRETVRLLDDWMARVEADPDGGTVGALYRHGFLAVACNPLMLALYSRKSRVLGTFVRRRGPAIYTPRYLASRQMVRALQHAGVIRADLPADVVNHTLLLLQVGLVSIGEVFDPALFPPFEAVAQALGEVMQRALAPEAPVDPHVAKAAMRAHFAQLRALIAASFASPAAP